MCCRCAICPRTAKIVPFVSDFFDSSIYIDARKRHSQMVWVDRFHELIRPNGHSKNRNPFFTANAGSRRSSPRPLPESLWKNSSTEKLRQNICRRARAPYCPWRKAPNLSSKAGGFFCANCEPGYCRSWKWVSCQALHSPECRLIAPAILEQCRCGSTKSGRLNGKATGFAPE